MPTITDFHNLIEKFLNKANKEDRQIALDGQTHRVGIDRYKNKKAIHVVSAYCVLSGFLLAQVKTAEKSNEITVIPQLLHQLDIRGTLISIDVMGY